MRTYPYAYAGKAESSFSFNFEHATERRAEALLHQSKSFKPVRHVRKQ